MHDVAICLEDRPGALAEMGEALARKGISIEGGGAWVCGASGIAHFLFADGEAARAALEGAGVRVLAVRETVAQRLRRAWPGRKTLPRDGGCAGRRPGALQRPRW